MEDGAESQDYSKIWIVIRYLGGNTVAIGERKLR